MVWDYAGDNYVHRLIENSTDGCSLLILFNTIYFVFLGKFVEYDGAGAENLEVFFLNYPSHIASKSPFFIKQAATGPSSGSRIEGEGGSFFSMTRKKTKGSVYFFFTFPDFVGEGGLVEKFEKSIHFLFFFCLLR